VNTILEAISKAEPEHIALIDCNGKYTYRTYLNHIISIADFLKQTGVAYDDRILIVAKQTELFLATFHAVQYIGAIPVPLEKSTTTSRIKDLYEITKATAVISDDKNIYVKAILYDDIKRACANDAFVVPKVNPVSEILYTTGTTGKSKGVVISQRADIAVAENIIYGVKKHFDDVELIPMPLNHSFALRRYFSNMIIGSTAVLCDGVINLKNFFNLIEENNCNAIAMNPSAYSIIYKLAKEKFREVGKRLNYVQFGSAHLPEESKKQLIDLLPNTHLYNMYGSTEAGCSCVIDFSKDKNLSNCIGKPTVNSSFAVVDENDMLIISNENNMGRLICSGSMAMNGYLNDEKSTRDVMMGKYIFSNDLGYIDEDGMIYVFGRCDDVITCGGNKINPEEVEDIVKLSGMVEDCVCVAYNDEKMGTVPKLIVVPKVNYSEKELFTFLSKNLEYYMIPKKYEMAYSIYKSFNGKPLRRKYR